MRDDAGAGLESLFEDRLETVVDVLAHVEQDDVGVGQVVDPEDVALADIDLVAQARFPGLLFGDFDHLRVDIDADAAPGAELLQSGDEHDRVAATQVINDVFLADLGDFAHAVDHVLRRRHPADHDVVFDFRRLAEVGDQLAAVFDHQHFFAGDLGVVVRLPGRGDFDGIFGGAYFVGAFGAAAADVLAVDDDRGLLVRQEDFDLHDLLIGARLFEIAWLGGPGRCTRPGADQQNDGDREGDDADEAPRHGQLFTIHTAPFLRDDCRTLCKTKRRGDGSSLGSSRAGRT